MKNILGSISFAIILMWSAAAASAATVELTWAPNSEPDIAGYVVFYGTTPRQYIGSIDVGNQTSLQFVEPDSTMRYFFAVRAYNSSGLQSDFSAEVSTDDPTTLERTGITSNVPTPQLLTAETANVPSPQVAAATLDVDKPAPQPAGSHIVFTATASGGRFYKYKWWVFDGVEWVIAKEWSSSNRFTWTPAEPNASYQVLVSVRHGSGPSRASAGIAVGFPISASTRPSCRLPQCQGKMPLNSDRRRHE